MKISPVNLSIYCKVGEMRAEIHDFTVNPIADHPLSIQQQAVAFVLDC